MGSREPAYEPRIARREEPTYVPPAWVKLARVEEPACPLFTGYTAIVETFEVSETALQAELAKYRELLSRDQYAPDVAARHVEREREKRIGRELKRWKLSRLAERSARPYVHVEELAPAKLRTVRFWR